MPDHGLMISSPAICQRSYLVRSVRVCDISLQLSTVLLLSDLSQSNSILKFLSCVLSKNDVCGFKLWWGQAYLVAQCRMIIINLKLNHKHHRLCAHDNVFASFSIVWK